MTNPSTSTSRSDPAPAGNTYIKSIARAHRGMNQVMGEVDAERDHGLDALHNEPDQQNREDELPHRGRSEGPLRNEHARHRHTHEDVGDVDVPTGVPVNRDGYSQQHEAVGGHGQHRYGEEVVQPRWGWRQRTTAFFGPGRQVCRPACLGVPDDVKGQ